MRFSLLTVFTSLATKAFGQTNLHIVIIVLFYVSCTNSTQGKSPSEVIGEKDTSSAHNLTNNSDTTKWTDKFLELKRAITTGDMKATKAFIDFPIKNEGNEIWYLADSRLVMEIDPAEIKPFTEGDFDKYCSTIFSLDLRKTFEKLDVGKLFETTKSTSPEIEVLSDSKSKLEASYDKSNHKLVLTLLTSERICQNLLLYTSSTFRLINKSNSGKFTLQDSVIAAKSKPVDSP